jgi:ribosomal protein S18 acetylase RimI-like enzyme
LAKVEVKRLTIKDYEAIIDLWTCAGLPHKPKGRDSRVMMGKMMKEYPDLFLGAFDKNRLVGAVIASYENRMKGWINRLAVDPEYRRQGIAKRLVEEAEKVLERYGAAIFCVLIETPNKESENLFRKMGYNAHKDVLYVTKRENENI